MIKLKTILKEEIRLQKIREALGDDFLKKLSSEKKPSRSYDQIVSDTMKLVKQYKEEKEKS